MLSGPDLSVDVDGMHLPNPFVIGSGPPGACHPGCELTWQLSSWRTHSQHCPHQPQRMPRPLCEFLSRCHGRPPPQPTPAWSLSAKPPTPHAPAGTNYKVMKRAFDEGWGGVICKTLSLDSSKVRNVTPRYARKVGANGEVLAWENIELISDRPFETMLDDCRRLKEEYPNRCALRRAAAILTTFGSPAAGVLRCSANGARVVT